MSISMTHAKEPIIDTPVSTRDGQQFGYVKEIHGGYFKIDVPMARDFWLSREYIAENSLDSVVLSLRKDELDDHRLSEPGLDPVDSDDSGVLSAAEALSQRERMERELEAQRERMRAGLV